MIARLLSAAVLVVSAVGCTVERAPAASPPPAEPVPGAAPAGTVATITNPCPPVGVWRASGPTGTEEIKITGSGAKPGTYDVSYKGAMLPPGAAAQSGDKVTIDVGQSTGGMYTCAMSPSCTQMSCGFAGQAPTVFNKSN